LSTIEEAVEAVARGETVIVMDDENRENEGDFICAAEKVTPEIVNFMITHGRGLFCMPVLPEVCDRLQLAPMVDRNTAPLGTDFTTRRLTKRLSIFSVTTYEACLIPNGGIQR